MAIRIQAKRDLSRVEFIGEADDAIDHAHKECDYEEYLKTGDQSHLRFKPDCSPTRFVCNFEMKGKDSERVKNAILSGRDLDGKATIAYGSMTYQLVKHTLKAIEYDPKEPLETQIVLRKDDRQNVHDETVAILDRYGVVSGIWALYANLVMTPARAETKNS